MRVIAVDWSGAGDPATQRRTIWVAEAVDGVLRSLSSGRTRDETVDHLLDELDRHPQTFVGLDFAFSFPAWWVQRLGAGDGPGVWDVAEVRGESWLAACDPPFWGRPGRPRPAFGAGQDEWRRTEIDLPVGGRHPKSVFQIGGAGAVGTGSIRGMPALRRLRNVGVAIWPFDPWPQGGGPTTPVAAEVYPRWCTGPVVKSREASRRAHLAAAWPDLPSGSAALAAASEDAFDAACAALALSVSAAPRVVPDDVDRLEGRVLAPCRHALASGSATTP